MQILLCRASVFDELLQYHSEGFMPNWRTNRAMGLAVLDVAQTALKLVETIIAFSYDFDFVMLLKSNKTARFTG